MKIKIYVYFEGVLADFDGRVKELGIAPIHKDYSTAEEHKEDVRRFWEQIHEEKHFYDGLTPLPGSLEMVRTLYGEYKNIVVVSDSIADNGLNDTRAWIQKYLNKKVDLKNGGLYLSSGHENRKYILIDSAEEDINYWCDNGGRGIVYRSPQETLDRINGIVEALQLEDQKVFADKWEQTIQECKKQAAIVNADRSRGFITDEESRKERLGVAMDAWKQFKQFYQLEGIDVNDGEADNLYQEIYASVGIPLKKVPVRYYPSPEQLTVGTYWLHGIKNAEGLFHDNAPEGKTFKFKRMLKIGDETIPIDYYFTVEKEDHEMEKNRASKGGVWKCFDGRGKLEGYVWADASLDIREDEGELQSVALQDMYLNFTDPIWKMRSAHAVEGQRWLGLDKELPEDLKIPEEGFYSDETIGPPPRGLHYREQGIIAYDDTDEIVILGIKDRHAEVVEIPREINGKPVTVLDECCFTNCSESLRKVILPDTIREIGNSCFNNCKDLESIVLPDSINTIGSQAFCRCKGLTEIELPDSITTIGKFAFRDCTGLKKIVMPAGLKKLETGMFYDCSLPDDVDILLKEGLEIIESEIFKSWPHRLSFTLKLPHHVKTIADGAFVPGMNIVTDLPYDEKWFDC